MQETCNQNKDVTQAAQKKKAFSFIARFFYLHAIEPAFRTQGRSYVSYSNVVVYRSNYLLTLTLSRCPL